MSSELEAENTTRMDGYHSQIDEQQDGHSDKLQVLFWKIN